ncbi:MAG: hypothetical protein E7357_08065 [Clostridiales bacterium]|nr:hypothetical protein [Clostridiales bacterium]
MKKNKKLAALIIAATAFSAAGLIAIPKADVVAETDGQFYMAAGASVNLTDQTYGGMRWTTIVKEGYVPVVDAVPSEVFFGTFVIPTATYKANAGTEIKDMTGVVDVVSEYDASAALEGDLTYYSAINYDDILEDYKTLNGLTELTEDQTKTLLAQAYTMELTAVSYALYDDTYYYAEAEETSRSARQVANTAVLVNDANYVAATPEKKEQVDNYVGAERLKTLTNANEGYLDISELNADEVTAQEIDVSGFEYDFSTVSELLIGGKKISGYTYADGKLSISEGSAALEGGTQTWLSVFTTDNKVYSLPVIPADGVIREAKDLEIFCIESPVAYNHVDWAVKPLYGYYVLGGDLNCDGYAMKVSYSGFTSPGLTNVVGKEYGGFYGTLDGRGHTISNLKTRRYGIFGWMINATVKDIAFTGISSAVNQNGSMLFAPEVYNSTFDNVYIEATFYGDLAKNGYSIFGRPRSSTFNNFVVNAVGGTAVNTNARTWGLFNETRAWDATYGKTWCYTDNTFTNAYMISDCHVMEYNKTTSGDGTVSMDACVDGANWDTPNVGTKKHTENGIKRYTSVEDMLKNVYYNADGSENTTATKTDNDWTAFDSQYWNIDASTNTFAWR